jgi:hypothetical protein
MMLKFKKEGCDMRDITNLNREHDDKLWENDTVQFARLINELDLLGTFSDERLTELANATDLSQPEILELVERAKNVYDETLEQL